jgi:RHS repeat-associated protein
MVERATYQAFGAIESDYRPTRWGGFREDYKFTGKEEDIEVGLTYFGARYYQAHLGRWASADPLTIHALGSDLNPYAYVNGRVMSHVDPFGLEPVPPGGKDRRDHPNGTFSVAMPEGSPADFEVRDQDPKTLPASARGGKAVGDVMRRLSPFGNAEDLLERAIGMAQQAMASNAHLSAQGTGVGAGQAVVGTLAQGSHDPVSRIGFTLAAQELSNRGSQMSASGDLGPAVGTAGATGAINLALAAAEGGGLGTNGRVVYTATDVPVDLNRSVGTGSAGMGGTFVTETNITDPAAATNHAARNIPSQMTSRPGGIPQHISAIEVPEGALHPDPHAPSPPNFWLPPGTPGARVIGVWQVTEHPKWNTPIIKRVR